MGDTPIIVHNWEAYDWAPQWLYIHGIQSMLLMP